MTQATGLPNAVPAPTEMPVHELVAMRQSPYAFDERAVPADVLLALFEAARWAPSSYNEQPWRFIVASRAKPAEHAKVLACLVEGNQKWAIRAPVLAIGVFSRVLARTGAPNAAAQHDLGLAAATLTFEATSRGLSVHQMIGIVPEKARTTFGIPEGFDALTGIAIGYAAPPGAAPAELSERDKARRPRRPLAETLFTGSWGQAFTRADG